MISTSDVQAVEAQFVLQTYKRQPVVFVRGEGTRLFDEDGRSYLDFISGIGVCVLGHGHPGLAAVIAGPRLVHHQTRAEALAPLGEHRLGIQLSLVAILLGKAFDLPRFCWPFHPATYAQPPRQALRDNSEQ